MNFEKSATCFAVLLSSFVLTFFIEKSLIPILKREAKQPIYEGGPAWHKAKSGTPTMGGLAFLIAIFAVLLTVSIILFYQDEEEKAISLLLIICYGFLNALIGIVDDFKKIKKSQNEGLKPHEKLIFQTLLACAFITLRTFIFGSKTEIFFSDFEIDLGYFYYPLAVFLLVGITNCANLTDGIDGLATCVAFSISCVLLCISVLNHNEIFYVSSAMIGATVAFLIFNINPAKIFMGDTGSLFLGSVICACGFSLPNPLMILFICGVYIIEGWSVVLQVLSYKITGKRLFKMAPLHHHFEKLGYSECKICTVAMVITFVLSLPALIVILP